MSEYGHYITPPQKPNAQHSLLSHDPIKEKKAVRRKVIERAQWIERESYRRWLKKSRLQAGGDLI
jgi:hypothetical protein